jgi:hypothetical protein
MKLKTSYLTAIDAAKLLAVGNREIGRVEIGVGETDYVMISFGHQASEWWLIMDFDGDTWRARCDNIDAPNVTPGYTAALGNAMRTLLDSYGVIDGIRLLADAYEQETRPNMEVG